MLEGLFGEYHSSSAALGQQRPEVTRQPLVHDWLASYKALCNVNCRFVQITEGKLSFPLPSSLLVCILLSPFIPPLSLPPSLTLSLTPPSLLPHSLTPSSLTPSSVTLPPPSHSLLPFLPPLSSLLYTCRSLFLSSMPSLLLGCSGGGSCMNWLRRIPVTHRDLTRNPREMWLCTPQGVSCSVCHAVGREWRGGEGRMREEGKMV